MRKEFVDKVMSIMAQDQEVVFLSADLGFGSFEAIEATYPQRFYNVGIAEQNMIGLACGLNLAGKRVILYSIANFPTLRVVEQIRNYLLYHNTHTLIVCGGGGFSYGQLGYTHHAVEDIPIMKSLPKLSVFAPCEKYTLYKAMDKWHQGLGVAYLRLEKSSVSSVSNIKADIYELDCGILIGNSTENLVLTYGTVADIACAARVELKQKFNLDLGIIILNQLKNVYEELLPYLRLAQQVLFIEEATKTGGIGESLFAFCTLQQLTFAKAGILAIGDFISDTIGNQDYMRKLHGLDCASVSKFFVAG